MAASPRRPPSELDGAKQSGKPILAKIRTDLATVTSNERDQDWAGRLVVLKHSGRTGAGHDVGWSVNAPVGYGSIPDNWIEWFTPLDDELATGE